jgi:hypothetical protein
MSLREPISGTKRTLVLSGDEEAALIRELRNTIDYDH